MRYYLRLPTCPAWMSDATYRSFVAAGIVSTTAGGDDWLMRSTLPSLMRASGGCLPTFTGRTITEAVIDSALTAINKMNLYGVRTLMANGRHGIELHGGILWFELNRANQIYTKFDADMTQEQVRLALAVLFTGIARVFGM